MDESDRAGHRTHCCWRMGSCWRPVNMEGAIRPTAGYAQKWVSEWDCARSRGRKVDRPQISIQNSSMVTRMYKIGPDICGTSPKSFCDPKHQNLITALTPYSSEWTTELTTMNYGHKTPDSTNRNATANRWHTMRATNVGYLVHRHLLWVNARY